MLELNKIHEDDRGEIYLIEGDLKEHEEITIFTCRKGKARGGCIHKESDEFCTVFEGAIAYYVKDMRNPITLLKGDCIKIPKNTPHYFLALKDCIVAEWGAKPEEKKEKHLETRKIVDEINLKDAREQQIISQGET
jgi:mannose-6-phosphate isomerase-like protein (cupin superfamily)